MMCECHEVSEDVKRLRKTVKELSDAVGLSASTHFDALAALTERMKAVEDILLTNSEVDKVMNDIYNGSGTLARLIISTAKVVGAITIISAGIGSWWYALSHWRPS